MHVRTTHSHPPGLGARSDPSLQGIGHPFAESALSRGRPNGDTKQAGFALHAYCHVVAGGSTHRAATPTLETIDVHANRPFAGTK